jgi:TatD DNase family protein
MASDAHCHPYYLSRVNPDWERELTTKELSIAASATEAVDLAWNAALAERLRGKVALCFAVHPQMPLVAGGEGLVEAGRELLEREAAAGRLAAVGETGFDLFDADYRSTEAEQEKIFQHHLAIATRYGLPVVLHIRRAMHKVFAYDRRLKVLPAVVFHSYSGSFEEACSIVRRGVNAFFSFGTTILLNHKKAREVVARLPVERVLFETDAPYQPLWRHAYATWADIDAIIAEAARLRGDDAGELTAASDATFASIFCR